MEILGYGEDALTLWAMLNQIDFILTALSDTTPAPDCKLFFRPSFGRKGGVVSAQFGEFDFILATQNAVYLGESKWEHSAEYRQGRLRLDPVQLDRHKLFKFHIEQWVAGDCKTYGDFAARVANTERPFDLDKMMPPEGSRIATNLVEVLSTLRPFCSNLPRVRNVLLFFHNSLNEPQLKGLKVENFELVPIDFSRALSGNYIRIQVEPIPQG